MARLRARPSQAGSRRRCPKCQFQFVVPDAQQAAALATRPEEYAVFEGDYQAYYDSVVAADTAAVADCPRCGTRSYAPADQIGQEIECPDCGSKVVVARRPEAPVKQRATATEEEIYALLDEFYQQPESLPEADHVHIPVYCPVCNTLLHGTLDQVGKSLLCPDCYTPVVVPPPKEPASKKTTVAHPVDEEYALQKEIEKPAADSRAKEQPLIPLVCKLCQTRMYASVDQVGQLVTCPDCSTPVVVPRPQAKPPKPRVEGTLIGEYGVGKTVDRPAYTPRPDVRLARIEPGDTRAMEEAKPSGIVRVRQVPPQWPFLSGIFGFLWNPGTWPRLVGLMAALPVFLVPVVFALSLIVTPNLGLVSAIPWFGAMVMFAAGALLCMGWGFVAFPIFLAVVRDTAEGNDEIEDWPEPPFTDWIGEFFKVFNSVSVSVLCGVAAYQLLNSFGVRAALVLPVIVFFVFPVSLLSMMEGDSALKALSLSVVGSLFSKWWAWAFFYLETAVLVGAFLVVAGWTLLLAGPWALLLLGTLWVPILMLYSRLLGRVAWCCAPGSEREEGKAPDDRRPPPDKLPPTTPPPPPAQRQKPPLPRKRPSRSILDDDWNL